MTNLCESTFKFGFRQLVALDLYRNQYIGTEWTAPATNCKVTLS